MVFHSSESTDALSLLEHGNIIIVFIRYHIYNFFVKKSKEQCTVWGMIYACILSRGQRNKASKPQNTFIMPYIFNLMDIKIKKSLFHANIGHYSWRHPRLFAVVVHGALCSLLSPGFLPLHIPSFKYQPNKTKVSIRVVQTFLQYSL